MKHKLLFLKKKLFLGISIITVALLPVLSNTDQHDGLIQSLSLSNDEFADTQWYMDNPGYYIDYSFGFRLKEKCVSGVDMDVASAWKQMAGFTGEKHEVIVAVIDTGIDYSHPELSDHMWINQGEIPDDHIDNDHNGYVDDVYGWDFYNNDKSICHYDKTKKSFSRSDKDNHGTHIAGIIAAEANNNTGIAGIASNIDVKIMSLKINGGKNARGRMSDAVKAVSYAQRMGADICNISWGTTEYSKKLYQVMKTSDMLFVAAAGNAGTNNDEIPLYPANFKLNNLITVGAIDSNGELTEYSNYGAGTVDIAAPGDNIYSTIVGGYGTLSGSSMAVPQVTAIASLVYSYTGHIDAGKVKNVIINNIKPLPGLNKLIKYPGIPDANKIVKAAIKAVQGYKTQTSSNNKKSKNQRKEKTVKTNLPAAKKQLDNTKKIDKVKAINRATEINKATVISKATEKNNAAEINKTEKTNETNVTDRADKVINKEEIEIWNNRGIVKKSNKDKTEKTRKMAKTKKTEQLIGKNKDLNGSMDKLFRRFMAAYSITVNSDA